MGANLPSFMMSFEKGMRTIVENEYTRFLASGNLFWRDVAKVMQTGKSAEIIAWLMSTAQIYDQGPLGGNIQFDDLVAVKTELTVTNKGAGLKLRRNQLEDNDGNGFDLGGKWAADMGALMAYNPQKQVTQAIINGSKSTSLAYDSVQFFADNVVGDTFGHPINPKNKGTGYFWNWLHGSAVASGSTGTGVAYPGALPIYDASNTTTVDTALVNLNKLLAYIRSIKMPNGVDPRFLRISKLLVPPTMVARAQQLTNAKFIAQAAGSAAGSGDVEAVIRNWGLGQPIEVAEFAGVTLPDGASSDLTYYVVAEEARTTQLGGLIYLERDPYAITYYTGAGGGTGVDAELDRRDELEWHVRGRNAVSYGHPYAIFRVDAS